MPTKTITIKEEAYARLKSHKRDAESFSDVILRTVRPAVDLDELEQRLRQFTMSREAIDAVEEQVRRRHVPSKRRR